MSAELSIRRLITPLKNPYSLSFGDVSAYETFIVTMEDDEGFGLGEITPLPGYGTETSETVLDAFSRFGEDVSSGTPYSEAVHSLVGKAPFTASGLACALETWSEGVGVAYQTSLDEPVPICAHCPGSGPEQIRSEALRLAEAGFSVLKIKVGVRDVETDLARVRAAAAAGAGRVRLRLDANQGLSLRDAQRLCRELEGMDCLELLEQPFAPDDWAALEVLASNTAIPLMQDESIHDLSDVRRAATAGAGWVKFKLCKHPGMRATLELISRAEEFGLSVVLGNGVQTALGNHLELRVHARAALGTASEANGFLKPAESIFAHRLVVRNGQVFDNGLLRVRDSVRDVPAVSSFKLPEGTPDRKHLSTFND